MEVIQEHCGGYPGTFKGFFIVSCLCGGMRSLSAFLVTSLAKEVMFLVVLICLFVCGQHYAKSYKRRIGMKRYGRVLGSTMKN